MELQGEQNIFFLFYIKYYFLVLLSKYSVSDFKILSDDMMPKKKNALTLFPYSFNTIAYAI